MLRHGKDLRRPTRLPEPVWQATVRRVRGEFQEMPCLRVSREQARALFGLPEAASDGILKRLVEEGFLVRTADGQFVRRNAGR